MKQQPDNTPIFIAILIIVVIVVGLFLINRRDRRPVTPAVTPVPAADRSQPEPVQVRVITAMRDNEAKGLRDEIGPSFQELFSEEAFRQGMQIAEAEGGATQSVQIIRSPVIRQEDPWNGQWADGCIRLIRDRTEQNYLLRYYIEDGSWWLFGTIEIEACQR